jgi:glycine cleavage system aminomethyltransferase T
MTPARPSGGDRRGRSAAADGFDFDRLVRDYGDVDGEVAACRDRAALFDFSFVSIARVSGPRALDVIGCLTDRRLDDMPPGRMRYALRSDAGGRLRSDLTVWNEGAGAYLVMSGRRADVVDLAALAAPAAGRAAVEDLHGARAILAVQGPGSLVALGGLIDPEGLAALPYFGFAGFDVAGASCLVGRLGFTGERGFEIIVPVDRRADLWERLSTRARPAGFAAADCLRIEAGLALFANEFRLPVTAAEVGLEAFTARRDSRIRHRLVCFRAETDARPVLWRPPAELAAPGPGAIAVTSACHSVLAEGTLGLGFVSAGAEGLDRPFRDPSGRFRDVRTVPRPYFEAARRRPRGPWGRTGALR